MTLPIRQTSVGWECIVGLRVVAFVYRPQDQVKPLGGWNDYGSKRVAYPLPAEVTGIEGDYIYVVLDDEEEPRRMFWTNVRPR